MNSWINLTALWKIVVLGLAAGAGLPAIFAIGLRALNPRPAAAGAADGEQAQGAGTASPIGIVAAAVCFAVVLSAIGWGIDFIVSSS
jgi:hypothetical protein